MTNGEHYKTVIERTVAFRKFCTNKICKGKEANCIFSDKVHDALCHKCEFAWLDLEYKEELLPCPFCGCSKMKIERFNDTVSIKCAKCGIGTGWLLTEDDAIITWNMRTK